MAQTQQLIIHLSDQTLLYESDDINAINGLSDFCKEELDAYYASEEGNELTIDSAGENVYDAIESKAFLLGLF